MKGTTLVSTSALLHSIDRNREGEIIDCPARPISGHGVSLYIRRRGFYYDCHAASVYLCKFLLNFGSELQKRRWLD